MKYHLYNIMVTPLVIALFLWLAGSFICLETDWVFTSRPGSRLALLVIWLISSVMAILCIGACILESEEGPDEMKRRKRY